MSYVRRIINLQFKLGKGSFGADGADTVDLTGLRASVNIAKSGGVSMSELDMRVYGIPLPIMNQLTILNKLRYTDARFNTVTVSAGDEESGVAVCFTGIISEAWADGSAAPDVAFIIKAQTGLLEAIKPVAPVSYKGSVDVATVMSGIAAQMQPIRSLENSGVNIQIADPYLTGTLRDQALSVARAAAINMLIDDTVLAIWPYGLARNGQVAAINAQTGMVGYPAFTQNGIRVTTLYNPSLVFGRTVEVKSDLDPANGRWVIASINHALDSELPGGKWFSTIECGLIGQETPIVG